MNAEFAGWVERYKELDIKRERHGLGHDDEQEWLRLKEAIEHAAAGPACPPSSRRRDMRVPADLEVTFADRRGFQHAYLRNISEGGVYVETDKPLKLRDRFDLRIVVASPATELELRVEVVWVNRQPSPSSGLLPGVGVAFLDLPPDKKATIKSLIHRTLDKLAREKGTP
jgi:uncharacterized protein (TIGR02266 family)